MRLGFVMANLIHLIKKNLRNFWIRANTFLFLLYFYVKQIKIKIAEYESMKIKIEHYTMAWWRKCIKNKEKRLTKCSSITKRHNRRWTFIRIRFLFSFFWWTKMDFSFGHKFYMNALRIDNFRERRREWSSKEKNVWNVLLFVEWIESKHVARALNIDANTFLLLLVSDVVILMAVIAVVG